MRKLLCAVALAAVAWAQDADPKVERGRYLALEVARCQECHTPKLDTGEYIKSQMMKGTTLPYTPVNPASAWRSKTPDVTANSAILTRWGVEGMTKFLETGRNPRGSKAASPMPTYTMSHDDAEAIALFLKSIQ